VGGGETPSPQETPDIVAASGDTIFDPFDFKSLSINDNPFTKVQPLDNSDKVFERVRCRQHVNPLAAMHQVLPDEPTWEGEVSPFDDPTLPLYIDLGCGSGRYLLQLALKHKDKANFLGVEIRTQLAERAQHWAEEFNLRNAHFIGCNINAEGAWERILDKYPGPVTAFSVLMPDPWFKKKHYKRRMLTERLVNRISSKLEKGGGMFIQSDIYPVAVDMRAKLSENLDLMDVTNALPSATKIDGDDHDNKQNSEGDIDERLAMLKESWLWLDSNPSGIPTERETYVAEQGGKVWRALFRKR